MFWSSAKPLKRFSNNIDSVKSSYHPHDIQSPIENNYITANFDDVIRWVKTELQEKVLLQVSILELNIDIIKKMLLGFPSHTIKHYLFVLVILGFCWFFYHNDERWTSAVKLFMVKKYTSRIEHTKNRWLRYINDYAN